MTTLGAFLLLAICLFLLPTYTQSKHSTLKTCGPGRGLLKDGDGCKRCRDGYYSDSRTTLPCEPCRSCKHGVRKQCTWKKNTVCHGRQRGKSPCLKFFIFSQYKQFKRHCKRFFDRVQRKCKIGKRCWWLDDINAIMNPISTKTVVDSTTSDTVTELTVPDTQDTVMESTTSIMVMKTSSADPITKSNTPNIEAKSRITDVKINTSDTITKSIAADTTMKSATSETLTSHNTADMTKNPTTSDAVMKSSMPHTTTPTSPSDTALQSRISSSVKESTASQFYQAIFNTYTNEQASEPTSTATDMTSSVPSRTTFSIAATSLGKIPVHTFSEHVDQANYEETPILESLSVRNASDHHWNNYTAIIVLTAFVIIVIFVSLSMWRIKQKLKISRQDQQIQWVPDTTVGSEQHGSPSDSTNHHSISATPNTQLTELASDKFEHGQEYVLGGYEDVLSGISPYETITQPSSHGFGHVSGTEHVKSNQENAGRYFKRDTSQSLSNAEWGQVRNTLPLTKKKTTISPFAHANSDSVLIWSTKSQNYSRSQVAKIRPTFLFGNPSPKTVKTSSDLIPLRKSNFISRSISDYSAFESTEIDVSLAPNVFNGRLQSPVFHQLQESSPDSCIYDLSPHQSQNSSASNHLVLVSMGADSAKQMTVCSSQEVGGSNLIANNNTDFIPNSKEAKHIVGFTNNLQFEKAKDTRPENIFENLVKSEGTQTQHNAENTRSIYGHCWSTSCHFTREGGKLTKPTSDIVLDIPQNAVPDGETVLVQGLFTVDFHSLQHHLCEDEVIMSPIAEFQMSYMQRWAKFVKIILPCIHRNPRETFRVRFYQRNKAGDIEHGDVSLYDPGVNQELYYVKRANHVEIFTIHFTGFYCSVCGHTLPLELNAMVFGCYGIHDNEAWISLHIADRRLEIRDFKHSITEEEKNLRRTQLLAQEQIRLVDQYDCHSRLEFNLVVRKDPQIWEIITGTTKQIRRLQELVKCSCPSHVSGHVMPKKVGTNHICHHKLKWVFKPVGDAFPASFSCEVHVEHMLSSNSVTERHDACEEGITDIPVPPMYLPQQQVFSMPKPPLSEAAMAFPEIPSSRKPMFSRIEDRR